MKAFVSTNRNVGTVIYWLIAAVFIVCSCPWIIALGCSANTITNAALR